MHLTFWQPIPSFHQEGFLCALAEHPSMASVTLRVEQPVPEEQVRLGWPTPKFRGVKVDQITPDSIPEDGPDQIHVFTGFATHRSVWAAFERLPREAAGRAYAYTEAPETRDWKAPLRRIKYRLAARRLCGRLRGVLAIGKLGETFYRSICTPDTQIHRFAYYDCREAYFPNLSRSVAPPPNDPAVRLLYVGRLIHLKGVDRLLHALAPLRNQSWRLDLVGDGERRPGLEKLGHRLGLAGRITWHGAQPRVDVDPFYAKADYLVQPSRKDGWGMTIPEALRQGCEVLATDACGAVDLVKSAYRLTGSAVDWTNLLATAIATGPMDPIRRAANQARARAFSAEAGVRRFIEIMSKKA